MNRTLFASAALVATLAALPALAQTAPQTAVGSIGATYGHTDVDVGHNYAGDSYTLDGSVALPTGPDWGVTLNGNIGRDRTLGDADTDGAIGGHVYAKNERWLAGGFGQYINQGGDEAWTAGLEGQAYFNQFTLAGQAAYLKSHDDLDGHAWTFQGEGRFWATDNIRISAGGGYTRLDSGDKSDGWNLGASGEYRFAGSPFSMTAAYQHAQYDNIAGSPVDLNDDAFTVGVRYTFGAGTLRDRERSGADLGTAAYSLLSNLR